MRRTVAAIFLVGVVSCGGGGKTSRPGPTQPTAPSAPPAPPPNRWSVSGTLVDTAARHPVAGATIAPSWDLAAVQSGSDGSFELGSTTNPPFTPYRLSISGSDLVSREVWVSWARGPRTGVDFDVIVNRPPFSLEFYRQFVRGTYDAEGAPYVNFRWMTAPSFYVKTVDQNGRSIEPEVMAVVLEALPRAVREFSGGTLAVAALETGTEERAPREGWINVAIRRDRNERRTCGFAEIGANPGSITFNNDVCSCGSNKIPGALVLHEVGHAMGFFHVPDRRSVMYPFLPGSCPSGQLSPAEKFHAGIAYSRPRGNRDPDSDPSSGHYATPPQAITMYH